MERRHLSATTWVATHVAVGVLAAGGIVFLFADPWLSFDGDAARTRVLAVGVGIALLAVARVWWNQHQLRVQGAELMEALNQLLYGKDYAGQREAIEILVNALDSKDAVARRTAHEHLIRLTGQNFADDPNVWRAWWDAHKRTWSKR